jgi:hypothetical protein
MRAISPCPLVAAVAASASALWVLQNPLFPTRLRAGRSQSEHVSGLGECVMTGPFHHSGLLLGHCIARLLLKRVMGSLWRCCLFWSRVKPQAQPHRASTHCAPQPWPTAAPAPPYPWVVSSPIAVHGTKSAVIHTLFSSHI